MVEITACHTSLVSKVSFAAGKQRGRNETFGDVPDLKFESRSRIQSRYSDLIQESVLRVRRKENAKNFVLRGQVGLHPRKRNRKNPGE